MGGGGVKKKMTFSQNFLTVQFFLKLLIYSNDNDSTTFVFILEL